MNALKIGSSTALPCLGKGLKNIISDARRKEISYLQERVLALSTYNFRLVNAAVDMHRHIFKRATRIDGQVCHAPTSPCFQIEKEVQRTVL